jgi:hypothetical protein
MNDQEARCQCLASCLNPPLPESAFCKDHMNHCPRKAPLSGWEPKWEPERWNNNYAVRLTHNCYAYAMNVIDPNLIKACRKDPNCAVSFFQPGYVSRYTKFNDTDPKTCPNMIARIMADNPTVKPSAFELKCPAKTSKIALVVDEDQDYHFYRQDSNGYFSGKGGATHAKNIDANGNPIFDVELAFHNFGKDKDGRLNYDRFCGYFCVPRTIPLFMKSGGGNSRNPIGGGRRRLTRRRRRSS